MDSDLLVSHLKGLLQRRPDLRVVISSATVDAEVFKKYFSGNCPILKFPGRTFPVDIKFLAPDSNLLKITGKQEDVRQLGPFAGYFTFLFLIGFYFPSSFYYSRYYERAIRKVKELFDTNQAIGDILVFLPAADQCNEAVETSRKWNITGLLPLAYP
jgi:HrpA-like RNA helicase